MQIALGNLVQMKMAPLLPVEYKFLLFWLICPDWSSLPFCYFWATPAFGAGREVHETYAVTLY